jgi:serine protease Do
MSAPASAELVSDGLSTAVERARDSLVRITTGNRGVGSGVAWARPGIVVTNAHVAVHGELSVVARDGTRAAARVLALDEQADAAVLSVDLAGLRPAMVGDARSLKAGEIVLALGFSWGLTDTVTSGVVIGAGEDAGPWSGDWLVVNMRLRPGNSGGPVIDARGNVVGLSTIMAGSEVGLAVPSHVVEGVVNRVLH